MSHIDVPEKASVFKAPEKEKAGVFKNRWSVFWGATLFALAAMTIYFAANLVSRAGSIPAGSAPGAPYSVNVGQRDEVEVRIPIYHWVLFEPNKNIVIRRPDGESFLETPARKYYQFNKKTGKYDIETAGFGSDVSRVYIRSTADVARVDVSFVRG